MTGGGALDPVDTSHLLAPIHRELVALLRALAPGQWLLPTTAGDWRVRDVAAHLLDGQLRRLSFHRDRLPRPDAPVDHEYESVLRFVNGLNARGVDASRHLSPRVLTDLLDTVGAQAAAFLASLPPREPAFWPVAWAGEERSENWMDVGRDYTEYWHHQQQVRDAVGAPALVQARWLTPVVALGVRAVPRALAEIARPDGTSLRLVVSGGAGGRWRLVREGGRWRLTPDAPADDAQATVRIDAAAVARLWYSGRGPRPAASDAGREGDRVLCDAVLSARALMV
ncbi:MAG TPA: maleylpyruvate isomerase N-terminal domain-containing protein [Vicinamibacteria bacterium]|nr:maleylpyruvate isomerase N-terminal domain-containing protein [Vicinamibacteria bacterium]